MKQKRLLKPHIYRMILAIGIISLYAGIAASVTGHEGIGITCMVTTMITMLIATNEECNKQNRAA